MIGHEFLGYVAASLVLTTFCARRMTPLRAVAIGSNIAFIVYADQGRLWPILVLHLIMLPINCFRLAQLIHSPSTALLADERHPDMAVR
jgi:CRP/FNR family cyclic AMP-dependent transcriptional regulator